MKLRASNRALYLLLVLLGLGAIALNSSAFLIRPPAGLEIYPVDRVFKLDLAGRGAVIRRVGADGKKALAITASPGGNRLTVGRIPSGANAFVLEVEGYEPVRLDLEAEPLRTTRRSVYLKPTFGRVLLSAYDARTSGDGLPAIRISLGREVRGGSAAVAFPEVPPGEHGVEVEAPGYCEETAQVTVRPGKTTSLQVPLSPEIASPETMRIMLDWDAHPRDLDAHVMLSDSSTAVDRKHLYYGSKEGRTRGADPGLYAQLDVDWLNSEGVETITVYDRAAGVYQYFVDHFAGAGSLGHSNAEVTLITEGCKRNVYRVPPNCDQKWWYVADIRISDGESHIVERGECRSRIPYSWDEGKSS